MNKEKILKKNYDFQRIISTKKSYRYKSFIIYMEYTKDNNYHFGFSVGKKIGNAVIRNKIKRQMRNIVSQKDYQNGFNCIIIVNSNILKRTFLEMQHELLSILHQYNIIKELKNEKI